MNEPTRRQAAGLPHDRRAGPSRVERPRPPERFHATHRHARFPVRAAHRHFVALVSEFKLRPLQKQHALWDDRVRGQFHGACAELDQALAAAPLPMEEGTLTQAGVSSAGACSFTQLVLPGTLAASACHALAAHAQRAEALPVFQALLQR